MKACFLLLCAGNSSRMGQPKMLLPYHGKTLLTHIVDEALAIFPDDVYVITGAERTSIETALQAAYLLRHPPVRVLHNLSWAEGMASAIRRGIRAITDLPEVPDAVFLGVCDQPFVSSVLLQRMLHLKMASGKGIISCTYGDTMGTPVLFDKKYFGELAQLQGAHGAKKLLLKYADDMSTVDFPEGSIDIDTPADYEHVIRQ